MNNEIWGETHRLMIETEKLLFQPLSRRSQQTTPSTSTTANFNMKHNVLTDIEMTNSQETHSSTTVLANNISNFPNIELNTEIERIYQEFEQFCSVPHSCPVKEECFEPAFSTNQQGISDPPTQ